MGEPTHISETVNTVIEDLETGKVKRIHEITSLAEHYRQTNNRGGIAHVVTLVEKALKSGVTEEEIINALKGMSNKRGD